MFQDSFNTFKMFIFIEVVFITIMVPFTYSLCVDVVASWIFQFGATSNRRKRLAEIEITICY